MNGNKLQSIIKGLREAGESDTSSRGRVCWLAADELEQMSAALERIIHHAPGSWQADIAREAIGNKQEQSETNDTAAVQAIETGVMQPPNLASHFTSMDPGDLPPVSERDIAAMQAVINALYRHKSRQPIATREQIDLVRTMCNPIIGRRDGSDAAIEAVCVSAEIVQATLDGASALKANEGQS